MNNKININSIDNFLKINQGENEITIKRNIDNDICFIGNQSIVTIYLNVGSFDYNEFKTYHIFYDLMKNILGKYILQNYTPYQNGLPEDFVNLIDKEIICHTDSETTSSLKIQQKNGCISIKISKENNFDPKIKNSVKISSHGSQYGNYHHEFINFYNHLYDYCQSIKEAKHYQKKLIK